MNNVPAKTLRDASKNLSSSPLMTQEELDMFYCDSLNEQRGGDKVLDIQWGLLDVAPQQTYKAFLIGHSGVGKSTEITRLIQKINDRYSGTIRHFAAKCRRDFQKGWYGRGSLNRRRIDRIANFLRELNR